MQSNTQAAPSKPFQSLRERCGFKFTLALNPPSFNTTQPSYHNMPRRRKRTPELVAELLPSFPSPPPLPKPGKISQIKQVICRRRDQNTEHNMERQCTLNSFLQRTESDFPPAIGDMDNLLATACTPHFAACDESRCVQEIVPGCYVAFEADNSAWFGTTSKDSLATPNRRQWTHIVSISRGPSDDSTTCSSSASSDDGSDSDTSASTSSSDTYDEAIQTLRIYLPPVPDVEAEDEDPRQTLLSDSQLIAACEFLSRHKHGLKWVPFRADMESSSTSSSFTTSLSTSSSGYSSTSSSSFTTSSSAPSPILSVEDDGNESPPPVRLLITVPRNRRADALSVAFYFLASAFSCSVDEFVRELHFRRRCLSVWRCVLDREGVQRLERLLNEPRV